MKYSICAFLLMLALSTAVLAEVITPANNPLPNDYMKLVEEGVKDKLLDPESARFKVKGDPVFINGKWRCPILVNAKNRFGGYIGWEEWWCYIDQGRIEDCDLEPFTSIMKITR